MNRIFFQIVFSLAGHRQDFYCIFAIFFAMDHFFVKFWHTFVYEILKSSIFSSQMNKVTESRSYYLALALTAKNAPGL